MRKVGETPAAAASAASGLGLDGLGAAGPDSGNRDESQPQAVTGYFARGIVTRMGRDRFPLLRGICGLGEDRKAAE